MINKKVASNRKLSHIPEILYEAPAYPGEKVSPIPYMLIPQEKDMPIGVFIMEYRQTGEMEIGDNGKPEEILDGPYPHMYVDFTYLEEVLKEQLPNEDMPSLIDNIRVGLGLKPLAQARKDGNEMLDRVVSRANEIVAEHLKSKENKPS